MMHATRILLLVSAFSLAGLGAPAQAAPRVDRRVLVPSKRAAVPVKKVAPIPGQVTDKIPARTPKTVVASPRLRSRKIHRGDKVLIHSPQAARAKAGKLHLAGAMKKRAPRKTSYLNLIVFFLLAFGCVSFAVVMITRRSPMMSAMSLLVVFLCLAGLYVFLKAPFMAAIQLIVYAGAVIVLFIFVIMSMGLKDAYGVRKMTKDLAYFLGGLLLSGFGAFMFFYGVGMQAYILAGLFWLATLGLFILGGIEQPFTRFAGLAGASFAAAQILRLATVTSTVLSVPQAGKGKLEPLAAAHNLPETFGSARSVGAAVFGPNVFAFEALSLLLLAAIVAAVVIVRSRKEAS